MQTKLEMFVTADKMFLLFVFWRRIFLGGWNFLNGKERRNNGETISSCFLKYSNIYASMQTRFDKKMLSFFLLFVLIIIHLSTRFFFFHLYLKNIPKILQMLIEWGKFTEKLNIFLFKYCYLTFSYLIIVLTMIGISNSNKTRYQVGSQSRTNACI